MEKKFQSQNLRLLGGVLAVLGLVLAFHFKEDALSRNEQAAQWLGYLLLVIGSMAFFTNPETTTEIDVEKKWIRVTQKTIFGEKTKLTPFSQVLEVKVVRVGKASNWAESYFLNLVLKKGQTLHTGLRFSDKFEAHEEAEKWSEWIGCEATRI